MVVESEIRQSKFRSICVFCGNSQGKKSSDRDAAIELGQELETQWQTCTKGRLKWPLHSDAFIALPGGYGTLEVITWAQLGIHDKPVGLLNVDGYYNSLLSFMYKAVEEGFIRPTARQIVSAPTAKELCDEIRGIRPLP